MENRQKFDMQLEAPLPGRATTTASVSQLRTETDSLRAMGAWAAGVQAGR